MHLCAQASSPTHLPSAWEEHTLDRWLRPLHARPQSRDATDPQAQETSLNTHCWFPWRLWGVCYTVNSCQWLHDTVAHIMKKEKVKALVASQV